MILSGRYLQSTLTYKKTNADSTSVYLSILGYYNNKMAFESDLQDNVTTGMAYFEGAMDSATKTIILISHSNDKSGSVVFRQVLKLVDSMHLEWSFYDT